MISRIRMIVNKLLISKLMQTEKFWRNTVPEPYITDIKDSGINVLGKIENIRQNVQRMVVNMQLCYIIFIQIVHP